MFKYAAVAAASKMFSLNDATKSVYRKAGNVALNRMRSADGLPERYVDRAHWLIRTTEKHRILEDGDRVLELGTGWVHWESVILRLFYDIEVTAYDVADCRLFGTLRHYLAALADEVGSFEAIVGGQRVARARELISEAISADSFESFYRVMGFTYVVDPDGTLETLTPGFRLAVSSDVLEHIQEAKLAAYLQRLRELLVPGGFSVHQIDLVDHFHYFDVNVSPKNYYRYSDKIWRRLFESDVQYWNRVQRPEWLEMFTVAGFQPVEVEDVAEQLASLSLAPRYRSLAQADLECMQLRTVHRRK